MKFGGSLYLSLSLKSLFHCLEWYRAQSWVPYYLTSTSDPYTSASDQPVLRASPEADITMQLNALNWEWSWMRYCGWRCSGWHDGSMVGLIRSIMFVCLYSRIHAQTHTNRETHTHTHMPTSQVGGAHGYLWFISLMKCISFRFPVRFRFYFRTRNSKDQVMLS